MALIVNTDFSRLQIVLGLLVLILIVTVATMYLMQPSLQDPPHPGVTRYNDVDLDFVSVYKDDSSDTLMVSIKNTGNNSLNESLFTMGFAPPGANVYLRQETLTTATTTFNSSQKNLTCFKTSNGKIERIEPGETYTCSTGIKFPEPGNTLNITVDMAGTEKNWDYTCNLKNNTATKC